MTRVVVYPNNLDAMGYYRLIWPGVACVKAGHDVLVMDPGNEERLQWIPDSKGRLKDITTPECDVIVLQRPTQRLIVEAIQVWQSRGIKVVVDMDDNMRAISAVANPAAHKLLHGANTEVSWRYAADACQAADLVTVSTAALQNVYGGVVIRNHVPQAYLDVDPGPFKVPDMFGWTGAIGFRNQDPKETGGAFAKLTRAGYRFGVVGDGRGVREAFRLTENPPCTGVLPITIYANWLSRFAVGTIPLAPSAFNRSKSWLTLLVFAAVGVPTVHSPHDEYGLLNREQVGTVAYNPRHWYTHIKDLMDNPDIRELKAAHGRRVASRYVIENHADLWWNTWVSTLDTLSVSDVD